jgi:hypothetical protein
MAWERCERGINFLSENLKRRDFVVGLGVNLRIILKWILKILDVVEYSHFPQVLFSHKIKLRNFQVS